MNGTQKLEPAQSGQITIGACYAQFISFLFVFSGAKIYMNWILPTNPTSKNPVIRLYFKGMKKCYTAFDKKSRYKSAKILFSVHLIGFFIHLLIGMPFIWNLLVNIYPMIVQVYIGSRLYFLLKCA